MIKENAFNQIIAAVIPWVDILLAWNSTSAPRDSKDIQVYRKKPKFIDVKP
ncbi:hypothetical protein Pint_28833 [Pistacia integerrima]|uniref:Uncharacterized protein n=1 Tax=Pistacia integerrima TaxID=434235 RepID=A0ACC0X0Z0_9ROSI|nr:hypothetical protein Pint_28833 [Pistacia integerrima]